MIHRRGGQPVTRADQPRSAVFLVWRDTTHPEGGGSELYVERVAEWLVKRGWNVTICCAGYAGHPADEVRGGVRFRRRGGRLTVYAHGLAYLLGRGRKADVVVDVQNGVPFFSPLVRTRDVIALVHHVHREQWPIVYPGLGGRIGWWVESRVAPFVYRRHRYVTVSQATRDDLAQLGIAADRIDVVHNGLDVPRPVRLHPRASTPTICVLGRLVPHKQVEHALAAVASLRAHFPQIRLEVVGDGWWHEHLEARARELDVADVVTFLGQVSNADRDAALDRAWVLLAPSVKEGWGIAIMEAAARGVPAIAYRSAGGVGESIVDGETGWLVDNVDGFIKRTEEIIGDAALRDWMGAAASARAAQFNWDATGEQFAAIIEHTH